MALFLDSASQEDARRAAALGFVRGVTTNPILIAKAGAPALEAKADQPVLCSVPLVDAVCMETEKGLVVPLANYTLQPVQKVGLAVESKKSVQRVESVHHGNLQFKQEGGRVNFSLPLVETDFVKLYY